MHSRVNWTLVCVSWGADKPPAGSGGSSVHTVLNSPQSAFLLQNSKRIIYKNTNQVC